MTRNSNNEAREKLFVLLGQVLYESRGTSRSSSC
jgi:hypothetical protein